MSVCLEQACETPLHKAAQKGNLDVAQLLIGAGALVNILDYVSDAKQVRDAILDNKITSVVASCTCFRWRARGNAAMPPLW